MEAVANPSRTKDLYFVADGSGGHAFAETHEQHLRNVTRWRQVERARAPGEGQVPVDRVEPESLAAPAGLPTGAASAFTGDVAPAVPGAGQPAGRTPPRQGNRRGLDASEGTAKDPLLNRSFDLNTPKTVPAMRQP
jgi:UPF0755 protein